MAARRSAPEALPQDDLAAGLLALTMFLAPAAGAPTELLLQDTLKSAIVAFGALLAALAFFWQRRQASEPPAWHRILWLPLLLMAYALGSMAWSHAFLAGVEAVRWFVFALLAWLAVNVLTRERLPWLAAATFAGAVVASAWAAMQFLLDWRFFPQGPRPASTFINRNFYAEFAVCALPFGLALLARARQTWRAIALGAGNGLVLAGILMTGTRSALVALVLLAAVVPVIAWRCSGAWRLAGAARTWGLVALAASAILLAVLPTGSRDIALEGRGATAFERAVNRAQAIRPGDESLNLRVEMWRVTARMIAGHPLAGVGAGSWENVEPLYQPAGSQLETDYYAHNEYLQLLAEYGVVGWVFLSGLSAWLLCCAARTWRIAARSRTEKMTAHADEAAWRATALASLLALGVVSSIGFPWRLAATGALFALCLGLLAGSEARLRAPSLAGRVRWRAGWSYVAALACSALVVVTAYVTREAAAAERLLVRAAQIALAISAAPDRNDPRWEPAKVRMLDMVAQGVAINPHYRKITPMVADELARWGDWRDATWVWESVLSSRPYVVAILANAARGHLAMGDEAGARALLARARSIQPQAPAVRATERLLDRQAPGPAAASSQPDR